MNSEKTLSIVMPVYNEKEYIGKIIEKIESVELPVKKEIIIVDDGSTDGTREFLKEIQKKNPKLNIFFLRKNMGKGAALRFGFEKATGDIIVIQDADLEYEPSDWNHMLPIILEDKGDVVYGSRFYANPHRVLYILHALGNKIITSLVNLLCDVTFTDIEVCYKMFKREVLESISLTSNDFGFEVEFTVKVAKHKKWRLYETGISYYGRTYEEGKKIKWKDGLKALFYVLKYRWRR